MKDKAVVITGSSRGLGAVLARQLGAKGAKVVVSSAHHIEELQKLAQEIKGLAVVTDVTKEEDLQALAQKAVAEFGRIDVWINNAGIWLEESPIEAVDIAEFRRVMDVNLFGSVFGTRVALVQMKGQGGGVIVNIVSSAALRGRNLIAPYATSKWALRGFTDSVREENRDTNIKIIGVYPGGIKTHLFDGMEPAELADYMSPESVAEKIIANLEQENPQEELIMKRTGP